MKKKRYLPFGYQMNEGNIIPDILESSAVQSIFENYRNGASLQMLAKQMQQSGLKYRENAVWNKAMIARILDCEKYISEEFPAILPSDLFLQVQRLRKDRAQIYGGSLNPALRGIRDLICCQTCGQKLVRINHRDNVYIIWKCPSCNTETRYLPDIELMSSVLSAINRAREHHCRITFPAMYFLLSATVPMSRLLIIIFSSAFCYFFHHFLNACTQSGNRYHKQH